MERYSPDISLEQPRGRPYLSSVSNQTVLLVALLVIAPIVLLAAILWQRRLIALIPIAVGLNGVPLVIAGTNVRVEQAVGIIISVALGIAVLLGQRRLYLDRTARWLLVVAALHVLSSVLFSPARSYSLQQSASLIAVWSLYVVITNYVSDEQSLNALFRGIIAAGILYSVIGIAAFLLGRAGFGVGGANVDATSGAPYGAFGTMYEPNIFGSYCAAYFVLAVGMIAFSGGPSARGRERWARVLLLLAGLGLLLSFTRGAWLGALAGTGVVVLLARRFFGVRINAWRVIAPVIAVVVLSVILWFLPFEGAEFFRYKVRNLVNIQSENAVVRLLTYTLAMQQFIQRPLLGWGTFSFAPLTVEGLPFREFEGWHALWIGNFVLQVLHDTGVVGLLAFIALLWSLMAGAYRAAGRVMEVEPVNATRQLALFAAFAGLLVAFVFTTGFTLGYSWMFAGLLGAYTRVNSTTVPAAPHSAMAQAA